MMTLSKPAARSRNRRSACCGPAARSPGTCRSGREPAPRPAFWPCLAEEAERSAASSRTRRDHMAASESVAELLTRASSRTEVRPGDARAGAHYERVVIDGEPYFVKRLSPASDWIMRVTGDHVHRPYLVWQSGIMARSPASIDDTTVAMQVSGVSDDAVLTVVMRDVGAFLVPEGDAVVPPGQHRGFIEHMADLACAFWGWNDDIGLTTMEQRIRFFAPDNIAAELLAAEVPPPIAAAEAGWRSLPGRSPVLSGLASLLHDKPGLITGPLAATPRTFLHGDWKMGNLGTHPDGRTILLDWAYPGSGPACWDLCWYLALNRARAARTQAGGHRPVPGRARGSRSRH